MTKTTLPTHTQNQGGDGDTDGDRDDDNDDDSDDDRGGRIMIAQT